MGWGTGGDEEEEEECGKDRRKGSRRSAVVETISTEALDMVGVWIASSAVTAGGATAEQLATITATRAQNQLQRQLGNWD